jgi:hypothetical protein
MPGGIEFKERRFADGLRMFFPHDIFPKETCVLSRFCGQPAALLQQPDC